MANIRSTSLMYDAIVIGAGLSGLAAAKALAEAGRKVLVLEAKDRIGGRVHTYRSSIGDPNKYYADLGASFIHGIHGNPMVAIAEELNKPLRVEDGLAMGSRDHNGKPLPKEIEMLLGRNVMGTVFQGLRLSAQTSDETLSSTTPLSEPLFRPESPLYADLPDEARFYAESAARICDSWTGASLDKTSYKWWGWNRDTTGPDVFMSEGYQGIAEWLQEGLLANNKGEVRLSQEVTAIELSGDAEDEDAYVIVTTSTKSPGSEAEDTTQYKALTILVTLPLGVLQHNPPRFNPPLPARHIEATYNLGMGSINKVVLFYDEPAWWTERGHTETSWIFWPDPADPLKLVGPRRSATSEDEKSPPPRALTVMNLWNRSKTPALLLFIGADSSDRLEGYSDAEITNWAEETIGQYLRGPPSSAPPPKAREVVITRWRADPYACGTYSYIPVTPAEKVDAGDGASWDGEKPKLGDGLGGSPLDMMELSHPVWGNKCFFAGEHTSAEHFASAHGAYLSGLREGKHIEVALAARDEELGGRV